MDCRRCKDELGPYLDGELTRDRAPMLRAELDEHLLMCPRCRCLFVGCSETIRVYRVQPPPPLPAALHHRMMAEVARHGRPPNAVNRNLPS